MLASLQQAVRPLRTAHAWAALRGKPWSRSAVATLEPERDGSGLTSDGAQYSTSAADPAGDSLHEADIGVASRGDVVASVAGGDAAAPTAVPKSKSRKARASSVALPGGTAGSASALDAEGSGPGAAARRAAKGVRRSSTTAEPNAEASAGAGGEANPQPAETSGSASAEAAPAEKPKAKRSKKAAAEGASPAASSDAAGGGGAGGGTAAAGAATSPEGTAKTARKGGKGGKAAAGTAAVDAEASGSEAVPKATRSRTATKSTVKAPKEEGPSIEDLDFEDFFVLPRMSERLHRLLRGPDAQPGHGDTLANIKELKVWYQQTKTEKITKGLLSLTYLQQMDSDTLYDLYRMDAGPGFLSSEAWRQAVMEAIPKTFTDVQLRKVLDAMTAQVGAEAIAAQEALQDGLAAAQAELVTFDYVAYTLAGLPDGPNYEQRRSAALELTQSDVLRLHMYTKLGTPLQGLCYNFAMKSKRPTKITQGLGALLQGVKAGVKLPHERLLQDFGIPLPGSGQLLDYNFLAQRVQEVVAERPEDSMGSTAAVEVRERIMAMGGEVAQQLNKQEEEWAKANELSPEQGTENKLRLVYHLLRLQRYRDNPVPKTPAFPEPGEAEPHGSQTPGQQQQQ